MNRAARTGRMGVAATALALGLAGWTTASLAQPIVTDLSEHLISITSNFTGTDLLLFGAVHAEVAGSGEVVVVIRGPRKRVVVRRKDRFAGIWMNVESVRYNNVPGFYLVTSTKELSEIAPEAVLARHEIGLDHLQLRGRPERRGAKIDRAYREAVIRNMKRAGLYRERFGDIRFLGETLFRTEIHFPVNVPSGTYTAEVFLITDGRVVSAQSTPIFIDKTGLERRIHSFAHQSPAIYGLLAVLLALAAGWAAGAAFRKY